MTTTPFEAWWFAPADLKLRFGDGRPVEAGVTQTVDGPVKVDKHGLHFCPWALGALEFAPSALVTRVRIGGEVEMRGTLGCATERTPLWIADTSRPLHEFGVWCAEQALERERATGREPDPRSWAALEVKRRWLDGMATDNELAAAKAAAWSAARAAARDAQNAELERRLWLLAPVEMRPVEAQ